MLSLISLFQLTPNEVNFIFLNQVEEKKKESSLRLVDWMKMDTLPNEDIDWKMMIHQRN